jgi:hypothetical protein
MPLLTELEFPLERVFYKYIAPTALGFASKFATGKSAQPVVCEHRREIRLADDIMIATPRFKRLKLKRAKTKAPSHIGR